MDQGRSPLALAIRPMVFFTTLAVMVLMTVGAFGLGGIWALLTLGERDFTLSARSMPFWPEWLMPVDLLHHYAWAYLAGSLTLLFLLLPLALALLEKLVLAARSRRQRQAGGREIPGGEPSS